MMEIARVLESVVCCVLCVRSERVARRRARGAGAWPCDTVEERGRFDSWSTLLLEMLRSLVLRELHLES